MQAKLGRDHAVLDVVLAGERRWIIRVIIRFGKLLYKGWMKFAYALGWVNTRILLFLFFYVIITPAAVVARLLGKDLLAQRIDSDADSYWVAKDGSSFDPKSYLRQF